MTQNRQSCVPNAEPLSSVFSVRPAGALGRCDAPGVGVPEENCRRAWVTLDGSTSRLKRLPLEWDAKGIPSPLTGQAVMVGRETATRRCGMKRRELPEGTFVKAFENMRTSG